MNAQILSPDKLEVVESGCLVSLEEPTNSNSLILEVRSLTEEYVEERLIRENFESLKGKEIRWRHVQPELFSGSFLGTTLNAWLSDTGELMSKVEIHGDTDEQRRAQEWIREQVKDEKPVGFSVGFIRIFDNKGETSKIFFREQSVTPYPHCKDCGVVKIVTNETETQESSTPNPPEDVSGKSTSENPWDGIQLNLPKNFAGSVIFGEKKKKDDEEDEDEDEDVKEPKDSKTEEKEGVDSGSSKIKSTEQIQMESKTQELEAKTQELEAKLEISKGKFTELKKENTSLRDRVIELEVEKEIMASLPKRMRIVGLEGISEPARQKKRLSELLSFDDRPDESGKSQLDMFLESLESVAVKSEKTYRRRSAVETNDEATTGMARPPARKITDQQLEGMSPDEVLKAAGFQ